MLYDYVIRMLRLFYLFLMCLHLLMDCPIMLFEISELIDVIDVCTCDSLDVGMYVVI